MALLIASPMAAMKAIDFNYLQFLQVNIVILAELDVKIATHRFAYTALIIWLRNNLILIKKFVSTLQFCHYRIKKKLSAYKILNEF